MEPKKLTFGFNEQLGLFVVVIDHNGLDYEWRLYKGKLINSGCMGFDEGFMFSAADIAKQGPGLDPDMYLKSLTV